MGSRILVPQDGSTLAEQALPCAAMLAQGLSAVVVLLGIVSLPVEELADKAKHYLANIAGRLEDTGLRVHRVVRHRPAAQAIVDQTERMGIQNIVMATHGATRITRWTHGSVAERVLRSANVPVFLVRARDSNVRNTASACRRILVPLDGSRDAEHALSVIASFALALNAEICLYRVPIIRASGSLMDEWSMPSRDSIETFSQKVQAYLGAVALRLQARGISVSTVFQFGGVVNSIVGYAEANQIDLIAMCTRGRTDVVRWTLGNIADRVLRASRVPLLHVRAPSGGTFPRPVSEPPAVHIAGRQSFGLAVPTMREQGAF